MSRREPPTIRWLASQSNVDSKLLDQIQAWLDADWESHDIDKDAVRLIRRLVDTLRARHK